MEIEWEDPPATARINNQKRGQYAELAAILKASPGRWAKVPVFASRGEGRTESSANALALNLRNGKIQGFDKDQFDSAVDGTEVWVRFKLDASADLPGDDARVEDEDQDVDDEDGHSGEPLGSEVRAWAKSKGKEVPDRGRLPRALLDEYMQEMKPGVRAVK